MDKNNYTIQEVKRDVNTLIITSDVKGAYSFFKNLKDFIKESNLKNTDTKLYGEYYNLLIKLKFFSLTLLDDWNDIALLVNKHFEQIYYIDGFDLWEKIKVILLTVPVLNKRDEIKEKLRRSLLDCERPIINKLKYKNVDSLPIMVKDWLKDYTANFGLSKVDNLKKAQYLTNSDYIRKIDNEDKIKIKILFDLYEKLSLSSDSKEGYEGDIPMTVNGKYMIFSQGELDEIDPKIVSLLDSIKGYDDEQNDLSTLKEMVNQYPAGSLERKVIEEEITKLESL